MEFKLDGTAEEAMAQIEAKDYVFAFIRDGCKAVKVRVNFSSETRTIDGGGMFVIFRVIYLYMLVRASIYCYLSLILDAYCKEIVGWAVGETLETGHCVHVLRMALKHVDDTSGKELIYQSDRGCQYATKEYISL